MLLFFFGFLCLCCQMASFSSSVQKCHLFRALCVKMQVTTKWFQQKEREGKSFFLFGHERPMWMCEENLKLSRSALLHRKVRSNSVLIGLTALQLVYLHARVCIKHGHAILIIQHAPCLFYFLWDHLHCSHGTVLPRQNVEQLSPRLVCLTFIALRV